MGFKHNFITDVCDLAVRSKENNLGRREYVGYLETQSGSAITHFERRAAIAVIGTLLCSCASGPAIYLQNVAGDKVQCGPSYRHLGFFIEEGHETDRELLSRCVADYEGRGFHQITAPTMPAQ